MMEQSTSQTIQKPQEDQTTDLFNGCHLSVQLNGLNILTINEGTFIEEVLSFIAKEELKKKEIIKWNH